MSHQRIAVVVLDTLRRDIFQRYFEWVPGVQFNNAYSTSHWTVPAHASLLTGKYASEVGVHGKSRSFDCPEQSIAEVLNEDGYTTRKWTANMQIHWWDGWDRGFDQSRGPRQLHPTSDRSANWAKFIKDDDSSGVLKYISASKYALEAPESTFISLREGLRLFRDELAKQRADEVLARVRRTEFSDEEFLLMNLMEAHTPHLPPKPFRTFDKKVDFNIGEAFANAIDDPDENRRAYDDSAAYLSSIYKKIFTELREQFDVIITLSDHGELLGENGMWNHGYGVYPEVAKIPLSIWCSPESEISFDVKIRDDIVSILDVPQTIAEIAGVEFNSRGRDLTDELQSVPRLVEYHGFLPWHRDQLERMGVGEIFHERDGPLNGLITPEGYVYETHTEGVISTTGRSPGEDKRQLDENVSKIIKRDVATDSGEVTEDVKRRLEELGYA